jgi:beta-N-acetylhexosaminidase
VSAFGGRPNGTGRALDGVGCRFLRTFDGLEPSEHLLAAIRAGAASGVTLFRAKNVSSPTQVRALAAALQAARPAGNPPLLIGLDQEGGQLQAVGDGATAWPGNLALGATGSEALAREAGAAIGLEAAAMGATLVFAPVCDVLTLASATPLGTRPFGSDPVLVGRLAAAMTAGLQSAGVVATLKHFPGHGSAFGDSHVTMPTIEGSAAEIRERDLAPFAAGIAAGALGVLPGHLAAPALTGGRSIAATVSRELLVDLLRGELGFEGVTISDALDMGGAGATDLGATVVAAADAGMDLLMLLHPPDVEDAAVEALRAAAGDGRIGKANLASSEARIRRVREWLAGFDQPGIEVVGSVTHLDLARRIAEASVTLVRDPGELLPLGVGSGSHVAVLVPRPADLTPAETSSYLKVELGAALRNRGLNVEEHMIELDPSSGEIAGLVDAVEGADFVVVATFESVHFASQAVLVRRLAERRPTIAIALRSPYDVSTYPPGVTAVCTYGIQPPQIEAVADALVGRIPFAGRLPVELPQSVGPAR